MHLKFDPGTDIKGAATKPGPQAAKRRLPGPKGQHLAPFCVCSWSTMKDLCALGSPGFSGFWSGGGDVWLPGPQTAPPARGMPLCLATNVPPRTPIHHEGRSLPPVGAFEVRPKKGHKGNCNHARATGSQAPPPGAQNAAFGTLWWLFGVHHEGILVPWGRLDSRVCGRPEVIFGRPDHPWWGGGAHAQTAPPHPPVAGTRVRHPWQAPVACPSG